MHEASDDSTADVRLAERLTDIAVAASAAILEVDFRDCGARLKADDSPVSRADEAAHRIIGEGLARVVPAIPVISEEAVGDWQGRRPPDEFLLVDPLDGTREFLAGRLEYTVNIALIRGGTPVVGVIAAPALGLIWRGAIGKGAERLHFTAGKTELRRAEPVHTRPWPAGERVAAVSRSHLDPASETFLERLAPVRSIAAGSALKFCRLAEGAIDIYPRLAPTSEWDVAAGHAIVVAAGGAVFAADGGALRYGRAAERFRVPGFVAWGDAVAAQRIAG
ncbi:MAG: 3'(2'),5'-bisphosphate nucleotidase CysQ [Alphaproteobacteria bacterium]